MRLGHRVPSSPTTYLAAWVGAFVTAAAGARLTATTTMLATAFGFLALGSGVAIMASGLLQRVVAVTASGDGLRIRYAARPARFMRWSQVTAVVPPRWPLGAWRIRSQTGATSLMPSDLLSNEAVLLDTIRLAGLRFDGDVWIRHELAPSPAPVLNPPAAAAPPPRRAVDRSARPRSGRSASMRPPPR